MMRNKYYVRVKEQDVARFESHAERNGLTFNLLSNDFGTSMYSMLMADDEALGLKLALPLSGCLNFHRVMGRQLDNSKKNT